MTSSFWEHARAITPILAHSLAALEARTSARSSRDTADEAFITKVQESLAVVWADVIEDVREGHFELTPTYLSTVHRRLASDTGAEGPGVFFDKGTLESWTEFIAEITVEFPPEQAWVLAELYWGGHVQSFAFSLGWISLNGARLQEGQWAIYPPLLDHDQLLEHWEYSAPGPDFWDAESLRRLLAGYSRSQEPM